MNYGVTQKYVFEATLTSEVTNLDEVATIVICLKIKASVDTMFSNFVN